MFNLNLLPEILEQLKINNKLLAKLAGISDESLDELSTKAVDFSDVSVVKIPSEEELLREEDLDIEDKMRERFHDLAKSKNGGKSQFYEEEDVEDIMQEVNEA